MGTFMVHKVTFKGATTLAWSAVNSMRRVWKSDLDDQILLITMIILIN